VNLLRRRALGAIVGALLPVVGFAGVALCDERCHPLVQAAFGIPYVVFVLFPGIFVALQGWITVAAVVGFWAVVGAILGPHLFRSHAQRESGAK
jgi:hypothetical protein